MAKQDQRRLQQLERLYSEDESDGVTGEGVRKSKEDRKDRREEEIERRGQISNKERTSSKPKRDTLQTLGILFIVILILGVATLLFSDLGAMPEMRSRLNIPLILDSE